MFAIRKAHVTQRGGLENRQIFGMQPTLKELRDLLQIVYGELGGYSLRYVQIGSYA